MDQNVGSSALERLAQRCDHREFTSIGSILLR
jgi:hypothetical protein